MDLELVLSATSVEAYRSCHWRWFLQYVEGERGEASLEQAVGLAAHAAIEHYYNRWIAEPMKIVDRAEVIDVFDTTFLLEAPVVSAARPMRQIGRRVVNAYIEDVAPTLTPAFVEMPGRITVNGIGYSLHIDLVDTARVVRDTKVKGSKPRDATRYLFAMTGYSLGYRALTGERETDVQIDVMVRLKRDRPYHVPLRYGGPITNLDIGRFARQLEDTAEGIDRGDFAPTGLEAGECRWCPVRLSCSYYAEFNQIEGDQP